MRPTENKPWLVLSSNQCQGHCLGIRSGRAWSRPGSPPTALQQGQPQERTQAHALTPSSLPVGEPAQRWPQLSTPLTCLPSSQLCFGFLQLPSGCCGAASLEQHGCTRVHASQPSFPQQYRYAGLQWCLRWTSQSEKIFVTVDSQQTPSTSQHTLLPWAWHRLRLFKNSLRKVFNTRVCHSHDETYCAKAVLILDLKEEIQFLKLLKYMKCSLASTSVILKSCWIN